MPVSVLPSLLKGRKDSWKGWISLSRKHEESRSLERNRTEIDEEGIISEGQQIIFKSHQVIDYELRAKDPLEIYRV